MTALVYYLLKVCLCSGLLFLYYQLALKNKAFHQWNRFYLLSAVVLSLVLPLVQVMIFDGKEGDTARWIKAVQSADEYLETITVSSAPFLSTEQWLAAGYGVVSLAILTGLVLSLLKIRKLIQQYNVRRMEDIKFVNTSHPSTPFSFLHYIFWNQSIPLSSETGQRIFRHELVHVKEKHTLDKLFMQMVLALFWSNPVFWWIKKELRFIHEFIADKQAVGNGGTAAFAAMLLQTAFPVHHSSLVNPFFQTSIKRRLAMLTKIQNRRLNYSSRIVALPLIAFVAFAFTVRTKKDPVSHSFLFSSVTATDTIPKTKKEIESVDVNKAKKMLTVYYTDGSCETISEQEANNRGLINNNGYGNIARNNPASKSFGQDSSVKISIKGPTPLYVIDNIETSAEAVNKLDPNNIASIDVLKGELATKFYGEKGKNGVVEITTSAYKAAKLSATPLYILDGVEIEEKQKNSIDPSTIESMSVLKGPSAIAKYGNKGERGVIEITTKKTPAKELSVIEAISKPLTRNTLTPVAVEGKPLNTVTSSEVNQTNEMKPNLTEVVVIGHPLKKEPVFEQTETPASVDKEQWREHLQKQLMPLIIKATSSGMKPGAYTVNVRFLVEKDGSISDVKSLNDPGYELSAGAVQTVRIGPKWKPATQNGKVVRSYHTQPINFQIQAQ